MNIRQVATIVIITAVLACIGLSWMPLNAFFVGDEGVKFIQIESLAQKGLDGIQLPYPGAGIDTNNEFYPLIPPYAIDVKGEHYSQWPLLYPFLVSLLYRAFGFYGLVLISLISTAFSLAALAYLGKIIDIKTRASTIILLAVSTPMMVYAVLLWEHALALALVLWSVAFLIKGLRSPNKAVWLASGACFGLAVWVRNESALLLPAILLAWFRYKDARKDQRLLVSWAVGAAPVIAVMLVVQKMTVGESLGLDVSQFAKGGVATEISAFTGSALMFALYKLKLALVLLIYRFDPEPWILLGLAWLMFVAALARDDRWWSWPAMVASVWAILAVSFWALVTEPMQAGFLLNPVMVIYGIVSYKYKGENSSLVRILADIAIAFGLMALIFAPATGGVQWGVRFLLPSTILLAWLALTTIWQRPDRLEISPPVKSLIVKGLALAVVLSIIWQASGLFIIRNDRERDSDLVLQVSGRAEEVIVTDTFWLPQELAAIFSIRNIHFVDDAKKYEHLLRAMALNNIETFAFITTDKNNFAKWNEQDFDILDVDVGEKKELPSGFYLYSSKVVSSGQL